MKKCSKAWNKVTRRWEIVDNKKIKNFWEFPGGLGGGREAGTGSIPGPKSISQAAQPKKKKKQTKSLTSKDIFVFNIQKRQGKATPCPGHSHRASLKRWERISTPGPGPPAA